MCGVTYPQMGSKLSFGGFYKKKSVQIWIKWHLATARVKICKIFKCSFLAIANRFPSRTHGDMANWIFKLWDPLAPDLWVSPTKICAFRTRGVKSYHLSKTEGNRSCFRYSLVYPLRPGCLCPVRNQLKQLL